MVIAEVSRVWLKETRPEGNCLGFLPGEQRVQSLHCVGLHTEGYVHGPASNQPVELQSRTARGWGVVPVACIHYALKHVKPAYLRRKVIAFGYVEGFGRVTQKVRPRQAILN